MLHRHVVNQFLNQHRLADARAAEEPDLSALQIRLDQIDHFNSRLEHFESGGLIFERGRRPMNRIALLGFHRTEIVDRLAEHIQHAPERRTAHRH